jgi:hypothetical protein
MTKFLVWQKSNKIALNDKEGLLTESEFLSYENKEFCKRYAYKDQLDYSFFLKQGRPFFAYYHFVSAQIAKYGKMHKAM